MILLSISNDALTFYYYLFRKMKIDINDDKFCILHPKLNVRKKNAISKFEIRG